MRLYMSALSSLVLQTSQKRSWLAAAVWETAAPSYGSGHTPPESFSKGRCDDVTGPGMKPWDHPDGSASCGRLPSPPRWEPSPAPSCCTAFSSHPAASAPPPALPACPPLLMPERRKQTQVSHTDPPELRHQRGRQRTVFSFSFFFSSLSESLLSEVCFLFLLFFFFFFSFTILSLCIWGLHLHRNEICYFDWTTTPLCW